MNLEALVLEDPADDWIRVNLARTLAWTDQYRRAKTIYEELLRRDSTNRQAQFGLAEIAAWVGDSERAIRLCSAILADTPHHVEALGLIADVHRWNWRLTEARHLSQGLHVPLPHMVTTRIGLPLFFAAPTPSFFERCQPSGAANEADAKASTASKRIRITRPP